MDDPKSIIQYQTADYGSIRVRPAKVCYALNRNIGDLLEYVPPEKGIRRKTAAFGRL